MSLYVGEVSRKEKVAEEKRQRELESKYYDARTDVHNKHTLFVDKKRENGESIVASDFFLLNILWYRMRKHKDKRGIYVFWGGRKCYENEWLRV